MKQHPALLDISSYIDKELPSYRWREVKLHLEVCDTCRKEATSLRRLGEAVAEVPTLEIPVDFRKQVLRRVTPYHSYRKPALAASIVFASLTLLTGGTLVGWGLSTERGGGNDLGTILTSSIETILSLLRSTILVARIGWSVCSSLVESLACIVTHQGAAIPAVLVLTAVVLAYFLGRSLQGYHRNRIA